MRARLTYGCGPRLIAAFFLADLIVATVLAITHPGAGRSSQGSQRQVGAEFAGIPQKGTLLGDPAAPPQPPRERSDSRDARRPHGSGASSPASSTSGCNR